MDTEASRRSFAYLPLSDSPEPRSKPRSRSLTFASSDFSTALSEEDSVCLVCGETATLALDTCRHQFCQDCFTAYLQEETKGRSLVTCPKFQCREKVSDGMLRRYLDEASYQRYQRLQQDSALESNPDFRWCPKAGCRGYAVKGSTSSAMVCSQCAHAFCFYCGEDSHSTSRCRAKNDRSLRAWAKRHNAKYCPSCRMLVLRGTGCSHMNCARCGHQWCWLCGLPLAGHTQCQVQQYWLRNPPLSVCLALLISPMLMPFMFVILFVLMARSGFGNSLDDWHERSPCYFYSCLICLTLLLTPLLFVALLLGTGLLLCELYRDTRIDSREMKCGWCVLHCLLSILASPLVVVLLIGIAFILPLAGIGYLAFKGYIWQRRLRGDSLYLVPVGIPGYPLG